MKRFTICVLAMCLLLTGCSWMDGSYVSVTPHHQQSGGNTEQVVVAENYLELRTALEDLIADGAESGVVSVAEFGEEQLVNSMDMAIRSLKNYFPLGAYAVEDITYELGTSAGVPAVAVQISYLRTRTEILRIQTVSDMDEARELIREALNRYDASLVMLIENYETTDIQQLVEDFAATSPSSVMETPEVMEQTYPNTGKQRVLELKFSYQTNRDSLRNMQEQVERVFASAALYVSHDARDSQKLSQLYALLMERFSEYQIKTSITPAYSLLIHGVGDSKAFALVYAEMCSRAGLDCQTVVGTRNGEPWAWNIVLNDGYYYHVDLLDCQQQGGYRELTDDRMTNYVWDYSAYPACTGIPPEPPAEQTNPTEAPTEGPTVPPAEHPT